MEIRIPAAREERKGQAHTVYQIVISYRDWSNRVEKRYSDCSELHRVMKLRRRALNKPLPRFPGKQVWKHLFGGLSTADIDQRRQALEVYLNALVRSECALTSPFLPEFFGMPPFVREMWMLEAVSSS